MQDFRKLKIWQESYQIALSVYQISKDFPKDEMYGLTSQMRRCAVSIAANIAEGAGRDSHAEFARFLHISMGSASELECYLLLTHDLGYLAEADFAGLEQHLLTTKRQLHNFISAVQSEVRPKTKD